MSEDRLEGQAASGETKTGRAAGESPRQYSAPQRVLILDIWQRSELSAGEFAPLVGLSKHTLYVWKRRFDRDGPAGLEDRPRRRRGGTSRLSEATQRAALMLKRMHPDWGVDRIRDTLLRSDGYRASSSAIQRVLVDAGYEVELSPTAPHRTPASRRFERARPNQLWQSDLFTFSLKRENRKIYLIVFLDDHSRFVVGHALQSTATGALAREALESGIVAFGPPEEVLTDNGPQYRSWRGKSAFTKHLEKRGIRHILARPRHPQTVGKTERFWKTLWTECLESAICRDLADARTRVGHFIDYYNFQRTHQGIGGLVPADRFFGAEQQVRKDLEARVARKRAGAGAARRSPQALLSDGSRRRRRRVDPRRRRARHPDARRRWSGRSRSAGHRQANRRAERGGVG